MNRRDVLLSTLALGAAPFGAWAQTAAKPRTIGWLSTGKPDSAYTRDSFEAFTKKLKDLGYIEGRDFVVERRWSGGNSLTLPELARGLVELNPAIVIAESSPATAALQKQTRTVPILFANIGEPVEQGFVAGLARPGGNITGTTFRYELMRKLAELVRETLPTARRVALLEDERFAVSKIVSTPRRAHWHATTRTARKVSSVSRSWRTASSREPGLPTFRSRNRNACISSSICAPPARLTSRCRNRCCYARMR